VKIIKCYEDYAKLRKELKSKQYDLMNDSIGQYNTDGYSVDITLRDYDGNWYIDYDVYKLNGNPRYLDGGKVCDVFKMPLTDKGFWKLIKKKFEEYIK
jgi:hypothetical protein